MIINKAETIDGDPIVEMFELAYRARVPQEAVLDAATTLGVKIWFRTTKPIALLAGSSLPFRVDEVPCPDGVATPGRIAPLDKWDPENLFVGWLAIDPEQPVPTARPHLAGELGLRTIVTTPGGFVHRVVCGFPDAGVFLARPACVLEPSAPGGFGVRFVRNDELVLRHADAVRVAGKVGLDITALESPSSAVLQRLPQWASWEALADALDPGHHQYPPDLAAALRLWIERVRDSERGQRTPTQRQLAKFLPKGTPRPTAVVAAAVPFWRKRGEVATD